MTVSNFTSTTVTTRPTTWYDGTVMTQEEMRFVELVNQERASRGLRQLTINPVLVEAARKHSEEMGRLSYFSHNSPTQGLRTAMDRYLAERGSRPSWALVGENLFYCSIVDVERGHEALMNSEGHRANILEPRFESIGVGAYITESGEFYVTEMFLAETD